MASVKLRRDTARSHERRCRASPVAGVALTARGKGGLLVSQIDLVTGLPKDDR